MSGMIVTAQELAAILTPKVEETSPRGVECYFTKIDDEWGIKVYASAGKRDRAYDRQKLAAEYRLGPEVGSKVDIAEGKHAYFTQIADLLVPAYGYQPEGENWYALDNKAHQKYRVQITKLCDKLSEIGLPFEDCHCGNMGLIDGNLVCIDFGDGYGSSCAPDEDEWEEES